MSGTSLDGVSGAVCDCTPERVVLVTHWHVKFPPGLRARLDAAARNAARTWELGQLHHDLGASTPARHGPDWTGGGWTRRDCTDKPSFTNRAHRQPHS